MSIEAKIVADSIGLHSQRITTLEVVMPRIILAEFNTHRMLSRNSASSRAIPFKKMAKAVRENPFIPIKWMKNHSGMQGTEYFGEKETFVSTNPFDPNAPGEEGIRQNEQGRWVGPSQGLDIIPSLKEKWLWLRDIAIQEAEMLNNSGVLYHPNGDTSKLTGDEHGLTKQMCNRLLESFMWHKVLVTATEWENFFSLRLHEAAEIHIQKVAEAILGAMNSSVPVQLQSGQWHIPYGDTLTDDLILDQLNGTEHFEEFYNKPESIKTKIAVARCAQVSYTVVGEGDKPLNYVRLIELHDRLLTAGHMSPFEHVAQCMTTEEYELFINGKCIHELDGNPEGNSPIIAYEGSKGWSGNFRGWKQYRKMLPNENRIDNRLKKYVI